MVTRNNFQFPREILTFRHPTFAPLHHYTRALSALRRAGTPRARHWAHISLRVDGTGLTTTPIPYHGHAVELALDFTTHRLTASTSRGERGEFSLHGQPLSQFWGEVNALLAAFGVNLSAAKPDYPDAPPSYDSFIVQNYWRALLQIYLLLAQFRGEQRQPTSPVQFWSHHFDLAMLWFSGRLVPGQDPNDEENADEQMNFGFSFGDESLPEPYLYITAYPLPAGLVDSPLPGPAYWHTQGWNGAVLPYESLVDAPEPDTLVLNFWRTVLERGSELMK